jgi:hypothetical protein
MKKALFLSMSFLASMGVAGAQTPGAAQPGIIATDVTDAPDPARLGVARSLLSTLVPPEKRDAMIDGMMKSMMANITQGMTESPFFKEALAKEPRARSIFERFIARQQTESLTLLKQNMPSMIEAMSKAYARRFTAAQMGEMRAFFETPTGRIYIDQAATIMSDPDVAKWQRDLMASSMNRMPSEMTALMNELKALKPATRRR